MKKEDFIKKMNKKVRCAKCKSSSHTTKEHDKWAKGIEKENPLV